jgi:chromosome condensin MukBEF MukE localization factor
MASIQRSPLPSPTPSASDWQREVDQLVTDIERLARLGVIHAVVRRAGRRSGVTRVFLRFPLDC